jgi:hypothetical protein
MRPRIAQELELLRLYYPDIAHTEHAGEDWFHISRYALPPGWRVGPQPVEVAPIVFRVGAAYPTAEPYGFLTSAGINFNGAPPGNPGSAPAVPFPGEWAHFSWAPDGSWTPTHDVKVGSNLLTWVRSFGQRFREGA